MRSPRSSSPRQSHRGPPRPVRPPAPRYGSRRGPSLPRRPARTRPPAPRRPPRRRPRPARPVRHRDEKGPFHACCVGVMTSWAISVAGADRREIDRVDRTDPLGEGRGIDRVQRVLLERDRNVESGDPERAGPSIAATASSGPARTSRRARRSRASRSRPRASAATASGRPGSRSVRTHPCPLRRPRSTKEARSSSKKSGSSRLTPSRRNGPALFSVRLSVRVDHVFQRLRPYVTGELDSHERDHDTPTMNAASCWTGLTARPPTSNGSWIASCARK